MRVCGSLFVNNGGVTMAMTPKKRRFCVEYLKDWNATQAAIRAGYSEHTARAAGSRLFTDVDVKAELCRVRDEILGTEKEQLQYYVLQQLKKMAGSNITDVANITNNTMKVKDTDLLPKDIQESIEEISETRTKEGGSLKIKMHSKSKALELLGKYAGMFDSKIELSGSVDLPVTYEDKETRLKDLLNDLEQD